MAHLQWERERESVWVGKNWAFFPNALCSLSRDWGIRPETKAICSLHTTWQQILWNFFLKYTYLLCVKVWSEIMINDWYICYCLSNALWWTHERKRFFKFFFRNTFLYYSDVENYCALYRIGIANYKKLGMKQILKIGIQS